MGRVHIRALLDELQAEKVAAAMPTRRPSSRQLELFSEQAMGRTAYFERQIAQLPEPAAPRRRRGPRRAP